MPALAQIRRDLLGGRDGERVDDPGARELLEMITQPGQPVCGVRQLEHAEAETLAVESPTQHQRVRARARTELLGHIRGHPRVRSGGRREHGYARRQIGEHGPQSAVIRPEVVAPVGNAVRLVDHEQPCRGSQPGQDLVPEVGVVEPLGADEQHIHFPCCHLGLDGVPLLGIGRVDRAGGDPGPGRGRYLVAHQCEQRRDDHRRAAALRPQQRGRDEIHGGLAPAGPLDDQRSAPVRDQCLDGPPLVLAQPGSVGGVPDESGQYGIGRSPELCAVCVGHAPMQPDGCDKPRTTPRTCGQLIHRGSRNSAARGTVVP